MQMRSFKKMAREKKIKVLTLVVFLCLFGWFRKVKAIDVPNLKHLIRKGNNNENLEGVCIASENDVYSATDWSFPLEGKTEDQPSTERYFVPNLTSEFDCKFEKNHHCIDKWKSDVWKIPQDKDKKYDSIFDYRWEDLPTYVINKDTPLPERRIDIHQNISITLSIRSNNGLKILLCEGWLPQKYGCYRILFGMINESDINVKNNKNETIATYSYQNPIFSFDQWRSYQLSFSPTESIIIKDLNDGVEILNISDKNPLKVIFLFMESDNVSLWKVHENNFLYTNLSTNTTFGPLIKTTSKDLTICMLVSTCENCKLNFYLKDDQKMINLSSLNEIVLQGNWKLLKLFVKNYTKDQLQLFSETNGPENGFWMIDNVRICSERELKVKVLKNNNGSALNMSNNEISCHALSKQQWRPKPYILKREDIELPTSINTVFTTSIKLSNLKYKSQTIGDEKLPLILKYQGHHLCPENYTLKNASIDRIKSNGIVLVDGNEITINELIPYTLYSFSLHHLIYDDLAKVYELNTKELTNITENELPNIKIIPSNRSVKINLQPPSCNDNFGRLSYKYFIGNKTFPDKMGDFNYGPLNPFSNYTLRIETSRNSRGNFQKVMTFYNFTTGPDVADVVSYLDAYEITKKNVGLRYKLPKIINGEPEKVLVTYCTSLIRNKCDSIVENITKCVQYPDMFCINVKNLFGDQRYKLLLSVKNKGTHRSGKEREIEVITKSNVPGKISNLTYSVINCSQIAEYCNFNISWIHPWNQVGKITEFEIELIEIDANKGLSDIYTLSGEYSPSYYHIVRYLPYATTYNISVRAVNNKLKGDYVSIQGKIDHIGEHIDQIPVTKNINRDSFLIQVPPVDLRIDKSILTVIVQNDILKHIDEEYWNISNGNLCKDVGETWIAKVIEFSEEDQLIMIGDGTSEFSEIYQKQILNKNLLPDHEYCLTYIVHNIYKNISHTKTYHKIETTLPAALEIKESPNAVQTVMIILTLLILFILIAFALFRYRHRLKCRNERQDGEHIYEGIPFDNYSDVSEAVYNSTYDKLIHD